MKHLKINPKDQKSPLRAHVHGADTLSALPAAKETKVHPTNAGGENASVYFVGTATTIIQYEGLTIMTDPNFLHAGDHIHLGPGVTATRLTNPALDIHALPPIDLILLSHYHADHFDHEVEDSLRRDIPIITTPHAKSHLAGKKGDGEAFTNVHALNCFESVVVDIVVNGEGNEEEEGKGASEKEKKTRNVRGVKITAMPGKHVPDTGILATANEYLHAIPPVNGWMVELGSTKTQPPPQQGDDIDSENENEKEINPSSAPSSPSSWRCGYRIYITGDTLLVTSLSQIPTLYSDTGQTINLMLAHLGGTTIPSPTIPLVMVTMDAKQGVELIRLVRPDVVIPVHYDDYDVFLSPLEDFKRAVEEAGLAGKVVYLERGDGYRFRVEE
ncbi:hypothetical protein MMC14_007320 [Varicellaria rhodocarpa]|nr:hypothetical protein [Varicellaria rhodocarpa]